MTKLSSKRVQPLRVAVVSAATGSKGGACGRTARGSKGCSGAAATAVLTGERAAGSLTVFRHASHRLDDAEIACAAAEITGKLHADAILVGLGNRRTISREAISIPGVQNPHCSVPARGCARRRCMSASSSKPSIVRTSCPSQATAKAIQERAGSPLIRTVHAPQTPCSQPRCVPVSALLAQEVRKMRARLDHRGNLLAGRP